MKHKNIVTIGGGTGSFMLLSGLKKYPVNISAVVSMADDGGSTGVLRDELGVLPPGDVRQCLVALSESSKTLRELISYRFDGGCLTGHSFGNLFLSALEKISGNFAQGVEEASKILNVKGKVIPVTNKKVRLYIKLRNGEVLVGQKQLDHNEKVRKIGIERAYIKPKAKAYEKVLDKIKKADFIIIGPGDYYGSVLPNLLVPEVGKAIGNSRAKIILNCNLTNKKGQTEGLCLEDYVAKINRLIGKDRINFVTFNNKKPPRKLIEKYEKREGKKSIVTIKNNEVKKYKIYSADLIYKLAINKIKNDAISDERSFIRHDPKKLAKTIMKIINSGKS
jgi:uncharacterized cofD-like protein